MDNITQHLKYREGVNRPDLPSLILLSKSDFLFALLLVTFELLEVEQSYIPHLKAMMSGINAAKAQGCDCMFTFCHAYLKMGVLLHKMEIVHNQNFMTVVSHKLLLQATPNFNWSFRMGH